MRISKSLLVIAMLCMSCAAAVGAPRKRVPMRRANTAMSASMRRANTKPVPVSTLGPTVKYNDIDGPDGELWYYTTKLSSRIIGGNEYYTDYALEEYWFDIYDSNFKLVGTVHDKMRYEENEVRVPGPAEGIDLLPRITRHFFNGDDNLEVVVSMAVNIEGGGNNYRSVVYSLGGEQETVTVSRDGETVEAQVDKAIAQYDGYVVDVLDASTDAEENVYMSFDGSIDLGDFEYDGTNYWEMMSKVGMRYTTYGKASGAEGKPAKVFELYIPYIESQGDMESSPIMMTLERDGVPYMVFPKYREPFFNRFDSYDEDMTMREGNFLDIRLYKLTPTGAELVSLTSIPVTKLEGTSILANFYSVGDLRYTKDIDFDAAGRPLYTITRSNSIAGEDDVTGLCRYVYDADGNIVKTIFEGSDSDMSLTGIPGQDDQHLFVTSDDQQNFTYNIVNLRTGYGDNTVKIPYLVDTGYDEPEVLLFHADRAAVGDSYKYAFELKTPLVDEEDNNYLRVAWFNADGTFDRIDHINMGQQVLYAMSYLEGNVLNPKLFNDDEQYEYMLLVKRGVEGEELQEELIVAQGSPELTVCEPLLQVCPDPEKGNIKYVGIYQGATASDSRLVVGFGTDDYQYSTDFYDLPLFGSIDKIETIANGTADGAIAFYGHTLSAKGQDILVYTTAGTLAAAGHDAVSVETLPAGAYVVKAGSVVRKVVVGK